MTQYETEWHTMTQCDKLLQSMTQYDTVWDNMTQYDTVLHSLTQYNTVWHTMTRFDAEWHSMHSMTDYDTLFHSLIQDLTQFDILWHIIKYMRQNKWKNCYQVPNLLFRGRFFINIVKISIYHAACQYELLPAYSPWMLTLDGSFLRISVN